VGLDMSACNDPCELFNYGAVMTISSFSSMAADGAFYGSDMLVSATGGCVPCRGHERFKA
jgi:hypothetical protein